MPILWSPDIEKPTAVLLSRKWYGDPGEITIQAPVGAKWGRVTAQGVGGQGEFWGGGGASAGDRFPVNAPGEVFFLRIGSTSQGSVLGDSIFARMNGAAMGAILVYADRGRGNSNGGSAALSIGARKRDGQKGQPQIGGGGNPGGDAADYASLGFSGRGAIYGQRAGDPGGGGQLHPMYDEYGNYIGYYATPGGTGLICVEWFDADPGY